MNKRADFRERIGCALQFVYKVANDRSFEFERKSFDRGFIEFVRRVELVNHADRVRFESRERKIRGGSPRQWQWKRGEIGFAGILLRFVCLVLGGPLGELCSAVFGSVDGGRKSENFADDFVDAFAARVVERRTHF